MAETTAPRFTDAQLSEATLVVIDLADLADALSTPPPPHVPAEIIVEYDLPEKTDPRRCCFCPSHTLHRKGFVVRFDSSDHYLVGSHCGPKYLGLQFTSATGAHSKLKDRQAALRRLRQISASATGLRAWCDDILFGAGLKALDEAARKFKASAPDAFIRLRAIANGDGQLYEEVRVRDYAGEAIRKDNSEGNGGVSPIYRTERLPIGTLRGRGLLNTESIRDTVYALKAHAAQVASVMTKPTDGFVVSKLRNLAIEFDRKREAALDSVRSLQRAHLFFEPDHVQQLAQWARQASSNILRGENGQLVIDGRDGPILMEQLPAVLVPLPPKVEA